MFPLPAALCERGVIRATFRPLRDVVLCESDSDMEAINKGSNPFSPAAMRRFAGVRGSDRQFLRSYCELQASESVSKKVKIKIDMTRDPLTPNTAVFLTFAAAIDSLLQ